MSGRSISRRDGRSWIAGLNHGAHDASCALLRDGKLIVAVEQERLSRVKHAVNESPADALLWCLRQAGIELSDLDVVALGSDHDRLARWFGYDESERLEKLPFDRRDRLFPETHFGDGPRPDVVAVPHHLAHAASAFWPSGFDATAILVMDAMGDDCSTALAIGDSSGIRITERYRVEASLGYFYEAASDYAGLGRDGAGKLMGLAPYGRPTEDVGLEYAEDSIRWPIVPESEARGRQRIEDLVEGAMQFFERNCFPYERGCREDVMAYANFAASVQAAVGRVVLALARRVARETPSRNLAIAGGVGLNCTVNGQLASSGLFDRIWVQPMAHDAGVSLGAALFVASASKNGDSAFGRMPHAYWGPAAEERSVEDALRRAGLRGERLPLPELATATARIVADGGIVAWHQGRAEVGPRALGARSLLGDPRARRTLVRLNRCKGREMWRPLAPSVLAHRFDDFFEGAPSEFMTIAARVRPAVRSLIPAVTHVDGSARPQVVSRETNARYAHLLEAFEELTSLPLLVNTSLNTAREPICCAPEDSIRTFLDSGADALVIESFLVRRPA